MKGVLCDIEGTLIQRGVAIEGAVEAVAAVRKAGLKICFTTNTSTKTSFEMAENLRAVGFEVEPNDVVSTIDAALQFFEQRPGCAVKTLCMPTVAAQFAQFASSNDSTEDFILLGDIGMQFDHRLLSEVVAQVELGARLVTLSRNRLWYEQGVPRLDVGSYVSALEEATGILAMNTGKPSRIFLNAALNRLGIEPNKVLIVGDDSETDIAGGVSIGAVTVLVATGRSANTALDNPNRRPDFSIASIANLPKLIGA